MCDIDPLYKQSDVLASIEAQERFYKIIQVMLLFQYQLVSLS